MLYKRKTVFFCRDFGPKSWYFEWPPDYLNLKTSLLSLHQIETATGHVVSEQTKRKHMTPIWKGVNITFWRPHLTSPQHHARGNSAFDTWHWMNRFQQQNKWLVFPNNCTFISITLSECMYHFTRWFNWEYFYQCIFTTVRFEFMTRNKVEDVTVSGLGALSFEWNCSVDYGRREVWFEYSVYILDSLQHMDTTHNKFDKLQRFVCEC